MRISDWSSDVCSSDLYDLIILYINLPDMEGFEVLQRIRQSDAVPVMMLTARTSLEDRVRGLEQGADDYLAKPFAISELQARVQALRRSEERRVGKECVSTCKSRW